jgi:hypothetical protein
MTFYERFNRLQTELIEYCKECITRNHTGYFTIWLESETDISDGYRRIVKEQFGEYITKEIEYQLYFAGKNIIYAIQTFITLNEEYNLDELLDFVDIFITKQLDDFENDYDTTEWFVEN